MQTFGNSFECVEVLNLLPYRIYLRGLGWYNHHATPVIVPLTLHTVQVVDCWDVVAAQSRPPYGGFRIISASPCLLRNFFRRYCQSLFKYPRCINFHLSLENGVFCCRAPRCPAPGGGALA